MFLTGFILWSWLWLFLSIGYLFIFLFFFNFFFFLSIGYFLFEPIKFLSQTFTRNYITLVNRTLLFYNEVKRTNFFHRAIIMFGSTGLAVFSSVFMYMSWQAAPVLTTFGTDDLPISR